MAKHVEGGRNDYFGMKASPDEKDFMRKCAKHAKVNVSELTRKLFVEYAVANGLMLQTDKPV